MAQRNPRHGAAPARAEEFASLNWRVFSWPSLALRKDTLVCAERSEMALVVAFDEANFVSTLPALPANHHDLQPASRRDELDTPNPGTVNLTTMSYMTRV